jgi:hypothetical protein
MYQVAICDLKATKVIYGVSRRKMSMLFQDR